MRSYSASLHDGRARRTSHSSLIRVSGKVTSPYNGEVSAPFRSYVLVSREQIARNYRNVCSVVGPQVDVAGVVKADAYGHGALEISRVLLADKRGSGGLRFPHLQALAKCL